MPPTGRRRHTIQEDESSEEEEKTQSTQRRRRAAVSEDDEDGDGGEDGGDDAMEIDGEQDSQNQVVKKLVRYALACEYQRVSIKRTGISEKVIGKQRGSFKRVFEAAQRELRTKFGMQMVELVAKDKVTMKEKKAAQKTKGTSKSPTSYILTTILPPEYRTAAIMPPSLIGSTAEEAQYMGLTTMIVTLIALSPNGQVASHKLDALLKRLNIDKITDLGTKEALLKRMRMEGYTQEIRETTETETTLDYRVGPRGKVEIGNKGVQAFVKTMYGDAAPEDLEKNLQRSLGMDVAKIGDVNGEEADERGELDANHENGDPGPSTGRRGRPRRIPVDDD